MVRSTDVTWHEGAMNRTERWQHLGQRGVTVWFTGLPASGKSTIASGVEHRLLQEGRAAYLLDGDNLRHGLNGDLGFSAEDRAENVRRAAHAAHLLADGGQVALVSLVSPYVADRQRARELHQADGLPFVEVYVDTEPEECAQRDPKGLWTRALAGELKGFTGVDDPYEPPTTPELVLRGESVEQAVEAVLEAIPPLQG
jgi:adenylyl-sulfate kinase